MIEIGGYMGAEQYDSLEYHNEAIALNIGRNCFRYIIRAKKIKKILLPSYLCSAITDVCEDEKIEYEFYAIDKCFKPILNKNIEKGTYLYVINYFGQLDNDYLKMLSKKFSNIIVDNAQSFFQLPVQGIDTIYTCRKFFGVPDGAYIYTDTMLDDILETDYSVDRWEYIIGRTEKNAKEYYDKYRHNEELLEKLDIRKMSLMTKNVLKSLDYQKINQKRIENAKVLNEKLGNINNINVQIGEYGLYAYPMLVDKGKYIKKKLIDKNIYVPTLWPNVISNKESSEYAIYLTENLLPLPCDQRYTKADMEYVANLVSELIKDE